MKVTDITQEEMVGNILAVFAQTTAIERTEGRNWYPSANTFAKGLAGKYSLSLPQTCGIIAALSPQLGWGANLRAAEAICAYERPIAVLGDSVRKAERIREGELPAVVLGGNKVKAFYQNILTPRAKRENSAVTIDSHALAIAFGRVFQKDARPRVERPQDYDYVAGAYRLASAILGLLPSVTQATAWVAWRRLHSNPAQYNT